MSASVAVVFVVGLFIGTLLNVAIIRLPRERRLLGWPRCTRTGEPLAWWQLIPLLGWALQRGRARDGRPLAWLFPFIELLTGLTLARLHVLYDFRAPFWYLAFICCVLIVTGAIDWLHRYIYTFVILGAALLALVAGPIAGMNLVDVLLGALIAGFGFALLFMLAKILFPGKGAPFGLGDVYLGIFIGAAVGLNHLTGALFYGMLMAGIVAAFIILARRLRQATPEYISYGTYLCLGVILYVTIWGL